jgi:triphosphoribosyl-dephospho-CoA synthetase
MKICFETGYRSIIRTYDETHDINIAIVHTFLTLLSTFPDTFIARKVGVKETPYIERAVEIGIKRIDWITKTAGHVLKKGGLTTELGREAIYEFDCKLQNAKGEYNPGTTADLTAGSLFVALLCGLRF